MSDPYLYPGTNTLINRMDIKDPAKLQDLEAAIYRLKIGGLLPSGHFNYDHLKKIHHYLFGELYPWAGEERTVDISKSGSHFARYEFINREINKIFKQLNQEDNLLGLDKSSFCERLSYYFNEINASHPFREGNGRSLRAFCDLLAEKAGFDLDWSKVTRDTFIEANLAGFNGNEKPMEAIFRHISSPPR
ncbi:MAG: Fic family protein [Tatlockia sp.]|nr:Fic family protein [Tatlockia sp.]